MAKRKNFPLRIQEELFRELEAWADQELRSVNGQIEFLLRSAVEKRRGRKLRDSTGPPEDLKPKGGPESP